jgi:CRISPR-associated protein Csb2
MLRFRVRFPLGVYNAVSATAPPDAEWPPSPLRLIGALLAAAHGRPGQPPDLERDLIQRLCEAPAPLVQAPELARIGDDPVPGQAYLIRGATRWVSRNYVNPKVGLSPGNLSREKSPVSKAGLAVGDAELAFVWPDLEFPDDDLDRLRCLASDIAFLGTTRSPAIVSVDSSETDGAPEAWVPDESEMVAGSAAVRVPNAATLDAFDRRERARSSSSPRLEGTGMVPAIPTGRTVLYRPPRAVHDAAFDPQWWGETIVLALDTELSELIPKAPASYVFARALRVALLGAFAEPGSPGEAPPTLRGRGSEPHCAIVPLPTGRGPHADWRIRGVAFVLPSPERAPQIHEERARIVRGLAQLTGPDPKGERRFVQMPGAGKVWLSEPDARQAIQQTLRTSLYAGPASTWRTVTPVVHSHWQKDSRSGLLGQVEADCRHVGLPTPTSVEALRGGPGMMAPSRAPEQWRSLLGGPSGHLRLTFAEPIRGPVLLGRARHFGLGLLIPAEDEADRDGGSR